MKSHGPEVAVLRELPGGKLSSQYPWVVGREYEVVKRDASLIELKIGDTTATINPSRVEILPVVELHAKRIVSIAGREENTHEIICFEYKHELLEKYQHLVGERVKIRLIDTNGEFVLSRDSGATLLDLDAPNRGNAIGGTDDVLFARIGND